MPPNQSNTQHASTFEHSTRQLDQPESYRLHALATHVSPRTKRFIAEFRFKARIMMCHHAAFTPKYPDGSLPPVRSAFMIECASSDFPQRSRYHQMSSYPGMSRLVTSPNTLYFAEPKCMVGNGNGSCPSISGSAG